jgi:hypothetical protein
MGDVPNGAVSFCTFDNKIHFAIGATGEFVSIPYTQKQKNGLMAARLFGSFGFDLVEKV